MTDFRDNYGGRYARPHLSQEEADDLVQALQMEVANMIASALDAGSERDAVNEDEDLTEALERLVNSWWEVV